ncbi:MAG: AraC family transcriptional regulator, partial [Eubacterium sp.]|nr:AraC family transcriptional regulator [Eubacterium sp.]
MDTSKELNYRMYIQREEGFIRSSLQSEFSRYDAIKNGDLETVRANIEEIRKTFYVGKGSLSDNPLRNNIYHFVVAVGIIARVCVDAGMPHNESYTLSDIYIRRADVMRDPGEVMELLFEMQLDYAERMAKLHR